MPINPIHGYVTEKLSHRILPFGTQDSPTSLKMREVLAKLNDRAPELEVEGEMHGDAALDEQIRTRAD